MGKSTAFNISLLVYRRNRQAVKPSGSTQVLENEAGTAVVSKVEG